jgi:hypothetical protein
MNPASKKIQRRHRANLFSSQQEQELVKLLEAYLKENQAPKSIVPVQRFITLFCHKQNVNLKNKKAGISTKKAYALLNKHSVLQELYWPEKKAGKINREKKVVILPPPPHQKIDYVMKESNLAASLMSNPIISSTKDEEEKAHPNVDINT